MKPVGRHSEIGGKTSPEATIAHAKTPGEPDFQGDPASSPLLSETVITDGTTFARILRPLRRIATNRIYPSNESMAATLKTKVLAEERQDVILKTVSNGAGVCTFIDFKTV